MCVCVTVKIQFHSTSTCTHSFVLTLRSNHHAPLLVLAPYSKILDPPLSGIYLSIYIYVRDSYTARISCSHLSFITSGFIG